MGTSTRCRGLQLSVPVSKEENDNFCGDDHIFTLDPIRLVFFPFASEPQMDLHARLVVAVGITRDGQRRPTSVKK